jgi:uncharacterized protein YbbC (DUF1343 family)
MISRQVRTGIDQLIARATEFKGKRIALVCNEASLITDAVPSRVALIQNGFSLVKLFSPEHGLKSAGEDGSYQAHGTDSLTGLEVISLYGDALAPGEADLDNVDLVIFDLPDIGCRFYTYLWTMTCIMESCEKFNVSLLIADRPNPIAGRFEYAEGPMPDPACASFIGRWSMPLKHNCTLGELARYFQPVHTPNLWLEIMPMDNWNRSQTGGFPFFPTSPSIRSRKAASLYPGTGLLEGICINEGRGTSRPFEQFGAPWIHAPDLKDLIDSFGIPDLSTQTVTFIPASGLYRGETCHGLFLENTCMSECKPVAMGIKIIESLFTLYPDKIRERLYPTVANPGGSGHLDKLLGIPDALHRIVKNKNIVTEIGKEWEQSMRDFLIYT